MTTEQLADSIAELFADDAGYVDPREIARSERICLVPGHYSPRVDGLLTYRGKRFVLVYNVRLGEDHPRTRFSIAHELGHFYIDAHHRYLKQGGKPHPSMVDFTSDNQAEKDANQFAASLLLPASKVASIAKREEPSLRMIQRVANSFGTSLTATAIRLTKHSDFCCTIIHCSKDGINFSWSSEMMRAIGLGYISDHGIPDGTATAALFQNPRLTETEALVDSEIWFHCSSEREVYEEAMRLGNTGAVLSLIVAPEDDDDDFIAEL